MVNLPIKAIPSSGSTTASIPFSPVTTQSRPSPRPPASSRSQSTARGAANSGLRHFSAPLPGSTPRIPEAEEERKPLTMRRLLDWVRPAVRSEGRRKRQKKLVV